MRTISWLMLCCCLLQPAAAQEAPDALAATGFAGGVIVHQGCGEGKGTVALAAAENAIVQGLDTSAESVAAARGHIRDKGLYGRVTAAVFDGKTLPFIDNTVNVLVADKPFDVSTDEMLRVLCPRGILRMRAGGQWKTTVKPVPGEIDEWTHYLHDPAGTMVARDELVAPPRRLQWLAGPKWLRNHEFMASMHAMVTTGGRVFYIIDEGLRAHVFLPPRWVLIARDAFNGTVLWRRQLDSWHAHNWPMKSGPGHLPRRLVAAGDKVYVTMGIDAPLTALDAATGETIRTYDQTKTTQEVIVDKGVLYLLTDPKFKPIAYRETIMSWGQAKTNANTKYGWSAKSPQRTVMAVEAETGKLLWKHAANVAPLTLTLDDGRAMFLNGTNVVALDRKTGRPAWTSDDLRLKITPATGYTPRMVVSDGVVVLCHSAGVRAMVAKTGEMLWAGKLQGTGHNCPNDMFVIEGLVWSAQTGKAQTPGTDFQALDLHTGEVKKAYTAKNLNVYFMHQRCYPGRATERYILTAGTGTEFHEIGSDICQIHHYIRGSCIYGIMPANGLLYKPPDSCACHYHSKLTHFCALAAGSPTRLAPKQVPDAGRLEKGPAFSSIPNPKSEIRNGNDWPTYRANNARGGFVEQQVPAELRQAWQAEIGGKLSAMTVAGGKVFVSAIDRHTLYALDAETGKTAWTYLAGGRVDSPPTIHAGSAVFGCADGWVYCLRAADGQLAWRYRAAPAADQLVSQEQLESVWPIHGSVLVRNGTAYCLAGRNMFFDGGLRLVRLDVASGKRLGENVMNEIDPTTGDNLQAKMPGKAMPPANADILTCDEKYVYLGAQKLSFDGKRPEIVIEAGKERQQGGEDRHLFCPTGMLDESWFHRTYWIYGKNAGEGHGEYTAPPSNTTIGRIMVFDEKRLYAFRAVNYANTMHPRVGHYLYAADKDQAAAAAPAAPAEPAKKKGKSKAPKAKSKRVTHWQLDSPGVLAHAMAMAGETVFMAGPPDVAVEEKMFGFLPGADDEINRQLVAQEAAWRGEQGALLWAVSAADGKKAAEYKLDALPVWDGLAAAGGKLLIALKNGKVVCFSGK